MLGIKVPGRTDQKKKKKLLKDKMEVNKEAKGIVRSASGEVVGAGILLSPVRETVGL